MKVDGKPIEGECIAKGHEKWILISSCQFSAHRGGAGLSGHDRAVGVARLEDIVVTHTTDTSTALILKSMCGTDNHKSVIIESTQMNKGKEEVILKYTIDDVCFTSLSLSGHSSGDGQESRPMESISLNFSKLKMETYPVDRAYNKGAATECVYDSFKKELA